MTTQNIKNTIISMHQKMDDNELLAMLNHLTALAETQGYIKGADDVKEIAVKTIHKAFNS